MLLVLTVLLQQVTDPAMNQDGWFQYGLAGVLASLIYLLLKYIKQRDKHDSDSAKQRSEMYREDNRARDDRFADALKSIDVSGQRFINATNSNIEKFVQLVNKVMEQGNYQTQILIELKTIVSKLPGEFRSLKEDINEHLEKLSMNYDLTKKDDQ